MTKPARPDMTPGKKGAAGIKFNLLMLIAVMTLILNCAAEGLITKATPPRRFGEAVSVGNLKNSQINEASGLASSRIYPTVLWVINDGGNDAMLYAVGIDGADLGTFRIDGAGNYDWEALASFQLQDTAYLLIADVGDNWEQRETSSLYVVEEPSITKTGLSEDTPVSIAWHIRFTYEDGPRDCEAVAVDAAHQRVLLLSKRSLPPVLYELPLQPVDDDAIAVAQRVTTLPHFNWPTDMDLSPDGLSALVLTYNSVYLFPRRPDEDGSNAFDKQPQRLHFTQLNQQEAACFGFYGKSIYVTSEKRPAPLIRIDLEPDVTKP
ncbi:MAG: hypothetical protein OET63_03900 [Desulfobacterales bacterium]|nr:hypothetical protein [Desulfobacterales bacterium]